MTAPRVLLSIPNTLSTRNLLRTDVLPLVREATERVILIAPFADEPAFTREFVDDGVVSVPMSTYRPGRFERTLRSVIYNLYLAGPVPDSLQLFLHRWAENHPRVGRVRPDLTRRVLPVFRGLLPPLERLFVATGDAGSYEALLRRERPDVAVFSRLFFTDEIPLMRAAARGGVPTVGIVASWDNLTTKGPLLPRLDRLVVWNDLMREEAVRYHGYRAEQITVTGAPHHDAVFSGREQLPTREAFFARLGLDPAKRLITYAGEDPIIAPDAPQYVELLHAFLRQGRLRGGCQLLVRPHPQDDPRRFDAFRGRANVVVDLPGRPSHGHWMDMSRQDLVHLYATMRWSDVIVNVTSTIVLDAAFFDTPTVCIGFSYTAAPTFYQSPLRFFEMDHFRYVMRAGATTLVTRETELLDAVNGSLEDRARKAAGRRRIVEELAQFRDGGSGRRVAAAIMAAIPPTPARAGGGRHSKAAAAAPARAR
jgi:CDP-glycerol:poly(glycerophosphate) glycerophosphotransferase